MQMPEEGCMLVPAVLMDDKHCSILLLKVNGRGGVLYSYCMICIYDVFHALICGNI